MSFVSSRAAAIEATASEPDEVAASNLTAPLSLFIVAKR